MINFWETWWEDRQCAMEGYTEFMCSVGDRFRNRDFNGLLGLGGITC